MDEIGAEKPCESLTVESGASYLLQLTIEGKGAEPIFILRGQDILAPSAVFAWAHSAEKHGVGLRKLAGAWDTSGKMLAWYKRKMPD